MHRYQKDYQILKLVEEADYQCHHRDQYVIQDAVFNQNEV